MSLGGRPLKPVKIFFAFILIGSLFGQPACHGEKGEANDKSLEIGSAVQLLATTRGELAEQALRRLLPHERAALPYLEAALHTANPEGRKNLVMALRRLGLAESAPLLAHIAAYDSSLIPAREAWQTLRLWASEPSPGTDPNANANANPRGDASRKVLHKVDEIRGMGFLLLDP